MLNNEDETYKIIGSAMNVHKTLGNGFLERVYQDALELELIQNKIPYKREHRISIFYKKNRLRSSFRADFLCYDKIIVEIKALRNISYLESAQVINYLKASGLNTGLLINFGEKSLNFKRFII